ncbi:MAG: DUF3078 domain-containing protein [Bacteroidetes bacterium]|jgi:hypothetical protein|nr:DUF3078 domain-containing protein [Bacteroidota bacterium]
MKTTSLFMIALLLLTFSTLNAQEGDTTSNWTSKGNVGLNFSQSHLSNWAAGGENALNWQGILNYGIRYADDIQKWENNASFALGYSHLSDSKALKTDDKIEINSLYGYKAREKLFYSLEFSFKTQFADGFDYKTDSSTAISSFMSPGYFTLGIGMEYVPSKMFSINFAPITGRITIVSDQDMADNGDFGVDPATYDETTGVKLTDGKNMRFELGTKVIATLNVPVAENVNFTSKLELFSDYLKNPQNIDVDWQNLLTLKVNSWLNTNISAHLIYDDDIMITDKDGNTGPRTQFKEVLSVGISYNLK